MGRPASCRRRRRARRAAGQRRGEGGTRRRLLRTPGRDSPYSHEYCSGRASATVVLCVSCPNLLPTTLPEVSMTRTLAAALLLTWFPLVATSADDAPPPKAKVVVGQAAPEFKIKDATGKVID